MWLRRLHEKVQESRKDVNLALLSEERKCTVEHVLQRLREEVNKQKREPTDDLTSVQTRSALLHTQLVEEIGRWEHTLRTCAPRNVAYRASRGSKMVDE